MTDRIPSHAGRVILPPVTGQTNTYDMTMADDPIEVGTALNKANLMSDAAAAAVWPVVADRPSDPTPSAAFEALANRVILLCDYTNTASVSSGGTTITLNGDIENYNLLDIWIISNATPTGGYGEVPIYVDVGDAVDSNNRIGSANLRTETTPNPIHLITLIVDNSSNGHLVLSDISRGYRSSEYPDPNVAYSGAAKLEGNIITVSTSTSSMSAGNMRIIIIGHAF